METLKLKKSLKVDLALTTGMALLAAMLWYVYWVQPRDEFLHAVMDCMEDDTDEAAYQECARLVANSTR
tara:strand:+ start:375 stop:581 length:207 start_codon:yes stop_codon:yes gene_type:complete